MSNVGVKKELIGRISQGDIFREIDFIEHVTEKDGVIEVSKIVFPLIVVLTQDCDLLWDSEFRKRQQNQDKRIFSVLVAPLYNADHVYKGEHLSDLNLKMTEINRKKSPGDMLRNNQNPRYHYLWFPAEVPIVPSVVDFKHYFSVNVSMLEQFISNKFVCRISELFREDISQRFAAYLARIALPEITPGAEASPDLGAAVHKTA